MWKTFELWGKPIKEYPSLETRRIDLYLGF
jgi:hypothetical protein